MPFVSRRKFLFEAGGGLSGLALAALLDQQGLLAGPTPCSAPGASSPFSPRKPHFEPRAKAVISLFMSGGVSQVDTFDYKPALIKYAGQPLEGKGEIVVRQGHPGPLMPSPFRFQRYGQSGLEVSELFPHLASHIDELAIIKSVVGRSNDHVMAHYELATGTVRMGAPSLGSWVTYGLGSESRNLPAFVVIFDARGGPFGGPANWTAGYMPALYQGTVFRAAGDPILDLRPPSGVSAEQQKARLELLAQLNALDEARNPANSELAARIASYELAYRMQACAPEAADISQESEATRKLYGLDDPVTEPFGRQCLMARRLVERGVRFVQLYHGGLGNQNTDTWDAHGDVRSNHAQHAAETDLPIAGLLKDLKARGLIDTTLVIWQSEFGRMPISQRGLGRDHNPGTMTIWMTGAKIKGGQAIGASDEFGYKAEVQPVSVHDLHATILHLLGMDHTRLTYAYQGRQMRLTDVYGEPIPQITA
ncbi:MAG: DUF1501 domain-containing protein [Bryobacteraceae bacterium]|nr:DUF1501 domain-containing protein [Bryobacteraceae bacterium]MDW8378050.1 DUF1501 domain-containing protein [Bryobacterales bacterium]